MGAKILPTAGFMRSPSGNVLVSWDRVDDLTELIGNL